MPRADVVPGFSFVRSLGGVDEYRLDANGLDVLLVADHSAPVVTFQVTYRVGSRNEVTGTTGATHILEHMMFKGSEGFNDPKGNSVKQYLERVDHNPQGIPIRLYPLFGHKEKAAPKSLAIDPLMRFGQPFIVEVTIPTSRSPRVIRTRWIWRCSMAAARRSTWSPRRWR